MAPQLMKANTASFTASRPASRRSVVCLAQSRNQQSRGPCSQLVSALGTKAVASVLAAGLMLSSTPAIAAEARSLADLMRPDFEFVDQNKDGIITQEEIVTMSRQVAEETDFQVPPEEVVGFSMKLFDLNQDGVLKTDELLTSLALDSVVSEDAVDAGAVKVFDPNGDGNVDMKEWKAPFGNLGPDGEALKEYVFKRVDYLQGGNGQLNTTELANGITLMRVNILGY